VAHELERTRADDLGKCDLAVEQSLDAPDAL
jgi:hypothetical protein